MKAIFDSVIASYHRCRHSGALFDTFYEIFLSKSPEIAAKFIRTDIDRQKRMMKESLLEMLCLYSGVELAKQAIERLGKRHIQLEVRPEHYELWLDSLCEAIAKHDPEYREELDGQWREAMRPGINLMISVGKDVV